MEFYFNETEKGTISQTSKCKGFFRDNYYGNE